MLQKIAHLLNRHAFVTLLGTLPTANRGAIQQAAERQTQLTKPAGSLGKLEDIAVFLAGWKGVSALDHVQAIVAAGNHGVTDQGVSPFPRDVTQQMVMNFAHGGAAINALADLVGADLTVLPLSLDQPTQDISRTSAMTEQETLEALNAGIAAVDPASDLVFFGEMGIGNTTIAAALAATVYGGSGQDWAGPGTGLAPDGVVWKAQVIDRAVARHKQNHGHSAFDILMSVGGREICAIAGGVVAARHYRIPVILDGYVVSAAIAPLVLDNPAILDHCLAGHQSAEPAHRDLLKHYGLDPILDLGMRLGEGTGAALAVAIVKAAAFTHLRMATFAEAAISSSHHPGSET